MSEPALLDRIRQAPDDDGPRLVYADWLDEQGRADEAELIRVQCAYARQSPDDLDWSLVRRADDLLQRRADSWDPLTPHLRRAVHARGLADSVELDLYRAPDPEAMLAELPGRAPLLRRLALSVAPDAPMPSLDQLPTSIERLELVGPLGASDIEGLSRLPRLRSLSLLLHDPAPADASPLPQLDQLAQLRDLTVSRVGLDQLDTADLDAIARLTRLTHLGLGATATGLAALAPLRELRELRAPSLRQPADAAPWIAGLAQGLERLDLPDAEPLAARPVWPALRELQLDAPAPADLDQRAPGLRRLSLWAPPDLDALRALPRLPELRALAVNLRQSDGSGDADAALQALADIKQLDELAIPSRANRALHGLQDVDPTPLTRLAIRRLTVDLGLLNSTNDWKRLARKAGDDGPLPALRELVFASNPPTVPTVAAAARALPGLRRLRLPPPRGNATRLLRALEQLTPDLIDLSTRIPLRPPPMLDALRAALPRALVRWRGPCTLTVAAPGDPDSTGSW